MLITVYIFTAIDQIEFANKLRIKLIACVNCSEKKQQFLNGILEIFSNDNTLMKLLRGCEVTIVVYILFKL